MERLIRIGSIKPKNSASIAKSRIGIGFEKLDRAVFDPEKAYDRVAELGVKWVRIQSGWARTEKEKGVYDFTWFDEIVENLLKRSLKPWMCLCYGNGLYDEKAAEVFGAVGCPPIHTEEQKAAWRNYVKAVVARYKDRIDHFEVWNEPDGIWCWKHGVNATELGNFTIDTAKAIKEVDKNLTVIGGVICEREIAYLSEAFSTGMGKFIDAVSFHEYTSNEVNVFEKVRAIKALASTYNPNIEIIQGESGSQSRSNGSGALKEGAWTQRKQAKQLLRHTIADLMTEVKFTSYFSCMDMIEALNGKVDDKSSYLDYGYFGVLGADFDEDGFSTGEYKPKMSYYALQNLSAMFNEEYSKIDLPIMFIPEKSTRLIDGYDLKGSVVISSGFKRESGASVFTYWYPSELMTTEYEGTISLQIATLTKDVKLVDFMDGAIYKIPKDMIVDNGIGCYTIKHLPIKDYPMALIFGEF